jgi:hypothetical protein
MLKQLILTIPPSIWEDYKKALSKRIGVQVDDTQAESLASIDMFTGLMKTIHSVEQPKCGNCAGDLCDTCGECHDTQCYEYEGDCTRKSE